MLMGAFMLSNRDHFTMMQNDEHHDAAVEAANTAFEYCSYRIEHDRFWGQSNFPENEPDSDISSGSLTVSRVKNSRAINGLVTGTEAQFHVEILNNIEGTGSVDGVPKGACRFSITARRGTSAVGREATLVTAPLFDASALSSKMVRLNAKRIEVGSTDPVRNRIRSKGFIGVNLPQLKNLSFKPAAKATEKGLLWAAGSIHLNDSNGGKDYNMEDAGDLATAISTTQGTFLPKAQTNYEIHDLQFSEIKVSSQKRSVQGGVYVFTTAGVKLDDGTTVPVRMLQRRQASVVEGQLKAGIVQAFWYMGGDVPDDKVTALMGSGATPHRVTSLAFEIQPGVDADIDSRTVKIKPDVDVKVTGDFGVSSDEKNKVATLLFEPDKSQPKRKWYQSSISANGLIFIDGKVQGSGKFLAEGDVTLRPISVDLASDIDTDLCIFSGHDVRIKPPDDNEEIKNTSFRGLIYARNDLIYYAKGADVNIEGALVSKNGEVRISQADRVKLTYNPDYLDSILKKMPEARIRLEAAVWKEL